MSRGGAAHGVRIAAPARGTGGQYALIVDRAVPMTLEARTRLPTDRARRIRKAVAILRAFDHVGDAARALHPKQRSPAAPKAANANALCVKDWRCAPLRRAPGRDRSAQQLQRRRAAT